MIVLHYLENSRAQRILWLLEELALPYEIKTYKRHPKTDLAPPELKKVHPLGKSPVITDGDITIAESGAIIDYLVRNHGKDTLLPTPGSEAERQYIYWSHYAEGTLMLQLMLRLVFERVKTAPMPFFVRPIAKAISDQVSKAYIQPNIDANIRFIEDHLGKHEWFAGEALSGADFQMSFPLEAASTRGVITEERAPNIIAFVKRVQARPAYQRALSKDPSYKYII